MQRDVLLWTQSKLSGPWSAGEITGSLTSDVLNQITDAFDHLEPLVRVRLLVACAFLNASRKEELATELRALAAKASLDDHEWVRLYGTVLGDMDGKIHLQRSLSAFPVVEQTIHELEAKLQAQESHSTHTFMRPLEEQYLSERLLEQRGCPPRTPTHEQHFLVRADGAHTAAQLAGTRPGAATAVAASAASSGGRYSQILSGVKTNVVHTQLRKRNEDAEATMFVKSSHTWLAPPPPPTPVAAPTNPMKKGTVLDTNELPSIKSAISMKRRAQVLADADSSIAKRAASQTATLDHGSGLKSDAHGMGDMAAGTESHAGAVQDDEDEAAPNTF